jgi:N-acetylglucosaminyldiphosphoundecaprenol N-acetyl-beta-D-mannosaminyltransferase
MSERFPGLRVVGTYYPPYRPLSPEEEATVIAEINALKPDFLWIGLSTPKQEIQMAALRGKVKAKVMLGVGAAFDFHTGRVSQAPAWIQRAGFEWLFRLCMEPRRLASRYLRNNPLFLFHIVLQITGIRAYPVNGEQVRSI